MASTSIRKSGPRSRDTSTNVTAGAAAGVTVAKNRSRASRYADKSSMLRTKTVSLIKFAAVQPTDRSATVRFSNTCAACCAKLPLPTTSPLSIKRSLAGDKNNARAANLQHLRIARRRAEFGRVNPFDSNRCLIRHV